LERDDWQQGADWRRLDADDRERLGQDTRELLLALAHARARTAPADRAALTAALQLLDRAEAVQGLPPSRALWEERAAYLERLGDAAAAKAAQQRAAAIRPSTFRDHYLLATS